MECEFIPLDYSYFDYEDSNYIRIIGKTSKNKRVCIIDNYSPNFWIILKDKTPKKEIEKLLKQIEKIEIEKNSRKSKVTKVILKNKKFLEKDVQAIQIFVTNHKDMHDIASEIGDNDFIKARREYDINLITKYIMQDGIQPLCWQKIQGEILTQEDLGGIIKDLDVDICIKKISSEKIKEKSFTPKVMSYDIETTSVKLGEGKILMISTSTQKQTKVFTWKKTPKKLDFVEEYENEGEMIQAFVDYVKQESPDILCGYFSDGFDLPYLKARAQKFKITLTLGLDSSQPKFTRGRIPTGKLEGIIHIDIFRFIDAVYSQYLQTESLSLNEVAKELIGEQKEDFDFTKLKNMQESDWYDFLSYNKQDAIVTLNLFKKIWPDLVEFSKILKEPIFEISRDRMSAHVENYILHNLKRFDEIAEKRPLNNEIIERRAKQSFEGAFVFEPEPGIYEDIVIFDFTSMYSSVIITYNLSKSTYLCEEEHDIPKFKKEKGFFPTLLEEILKLRKKYKSEFKKNQNNLNKARSNAYKLLANASYGYLGFYGARYYCREAAASTARLAKENILSVIEKIKEKGFQVIYSDTDSIAFLRKEKTKEEVKDFLKELNKNLPGIMELDFEDFYKRGIFVSTRSREAGAKKKYALIDEKDNLKIRGFETVRRDWCKLSRDLQKDILYTILKTASKEKTLEKITKVINDLKSRKIQTKDLIIKTQLKKPINEYVSKGPHVIAAEKMIEQGIPISEGMVIEYYIGEKITKTNRIGEKVFLPTELVNYDIEYYLNNQVLPVIENILDVFNINIKEIIEGNKQTTLGSF